MSSLPDATLRPENTPLDTTAKKDPGRKKPKSGGKTKNAAKGSSPATTTEPSPESTATAATQPAAEARSRAVAAETGRGGVIDQAAATTVSALQGVRALLPTRRLPIYLAAGGLLVTGLLDPPLALGAGLAYEALRRWEPGSIQR